MTRSTEPVLVFKGSPEIAVERDGESIILTVGQETAVLSIEEAQAIGRAFVGTLERAEDDRRRSKSWVYRKLFS